MRYLTTTLILAGLVASAGVARAAVPATLTQQGRLLNGDGTAATGTVSIVFSIYAADTSGTALWSETQMVTLDDGYFSVQLGSVTAFPAGTFDGTTRYLGITVGTDSEMSPRETLSSVPYAIAAGHADSADDATGDIHPHSVTVNSVPVIKADGTLGAALTNGIRSIGVHYSAPATASPYTNVATLTFTPAVNASSLYLQARANCFGNSTDTNPADTFLSFSANPLLCFPIGSYCPGSLIYFQPTTATTGGVMEFVSVVNQSFVAGTQYSYPIYAGSTANAANVNCHLTYTAILGSQLAP